MRHLINLSVNLHRKNLFEEAEQYLIYALNLINGLVVKGLNDHAWDQQKYYILYNLGIGCYKQNNGDQAIVYFKECQKMDPNNGNIAAMIRLCENIGENDWEDEYDDEWEAEEEDED